LNSAFALVVNPYLQASKTRRRALLLATAMGSVAVLAAAARYRANQGQQAVPPHLQVNIPLLFGTWRFVPAAPQVVNPQTQQMLDDLYGEVVTRTYVDERGYHVMLSAAYGSDQRGGLEAHRPEVCYPAQGFVLQDQRDDQLVTPHGLIAVRRLRTLQGTRNEPVTYWFAMAATQNATAFDQRAARLRATLTGAIPDGILMRVSSIDVDARRAFRAQDAFIAALLDAVPPNTRARVLGHEPPIRLVEPRSGGGR
jgi:EpsI family protein